MNITTNEHGSIDFEETRLGHGQRCALLTEPKYLLWSDCAFLWHRFGRLDEPRDHAIQGTLFVDAFGMKQPSKLVNHSAGLTVSRMRLTSP